MAREEERLGTAMRLATLAEVARTAYNGVLDANVPLGGDVVVMGLGVVGQLVVRLLKRGGARTIVGVDHLALRRVFALQGGANHALQPTEDVAGIVRRLTDGRGADVVVEVSSTAAGLTTVRNRSSGRRSAEKTSALAWNESDLIFR